MNFVKTVRGKSSYFSFRFDGYSIFNEHVNARYLFVFVMDTDSFGILVKSPYIKILLSIDNPNFVEVLSLI